MTIRNSMNMSKRICYWLALLCWICGSSSSSSIGVSALGFFRGGDATGASRRLPQDQQHPNDGSDWLRRRRRAMEDKREDDDEEYEEDNIMADNMPPTDAPSSLFVATTASPTVAVTEGITLPPFNETTQATTYSLIPFTIEIQGDALLDPARESLFRSHLEQYLFESLFQGSNVLDAVQLDRPWTVTTPSTRRRRLQDTTTTAATATNVLLDYQGRVVLKDPVGFWDDRPTEQAVHESQVIELEDTGGLQGYFVDLYRKAQPRQDAVVLVRLQVGDRPRVRWDPEATWERIAALEEGDQEQMENEERGPQVDESQAKENAASTLAASNGLSTGVVIVIVCVLVLAVMACVVVACLLRIKKRRPSGSLRKLPGAPDVHAMEVTSDVDSEENLDIIHDKSLLRRHKNDSPTMTRTSSWDGGDDEEYSSGSSGKGNKGGSRISITRVTSLFRRSKSMPSDEIEVDDDGVIGSPPVSRAGSNATSTSHNSKRNALEESFEIFPHGTGTLRTSKSPVIDLTTPGHNSSGIGSSQKEVPKPGMRLIVQSSSRQRKASQEDHDEFDSVMENLNTNLYSMPSFDEESMMGYSLASADTGYKNNNGHQQQQQQQQLNVSQESEITMFTVEEGTPQKHFQEVPAPDDLARQQSDGDSSTESEPSTKNSMLPGVQNLLNRSKAPKPKSKKWYRPGKKKRAPGFISSDSESVNTLEDVLEEASAQSDSSGSSVFIEDDDESVEVGLVPSDHEGRLLPMDHGTDDEAASSYKEVDSVVSKDSSVDPDGLSDVNGSADLSALGYYTREESYNLPLNMLPQITPVPSEEMDEMVLKTPVVNNAGFGSMTPAAFPDNVSDAPSDERPNNFATLAGRSSLMDPSESVQNVTMVDNDPAVANYLMKERRSMKQRTRRKRADRKQSPVTMEV
jgi:hypothetical protein